MRVNLKADVPAHEAGKRLDQVLANLFSEYSRSCLQQWVKASAVTVGGEIVLQVRHKMKGGESIAISADLEDQGDWHAEPIQLDILFEDDQLLVINKPAGLVVHPGAGNPAGTLVNALLHYDPALAKIPRAGIVHRLDKDTTGLMVVARTLPTHHALIEQLQERTVTREYQAIVQGLIISGGIVDAPIGRHPVHRQRMTVLSPDAAGAKPAVTRYRVVRKFSAHTHLQLQLETGRTHQIRVHMAHIAHPLVGDPLYGGRLLYPRDASPELRHCLEHFKRQALHASRLRLKHPVSGELCEWEVPLPEDMKQLLALLN